MRGKCNFAFNGFVKVLDIFVSEVINILNYMTHIVSLTFELSHVVCWISEIKKITCDTIFVNNLLTIIRCFTRKPTTFRIVKVSFYLLSNPLFCICHFRCLKEVMFLCCNYLSLWLDTCHNLTFHWKSDKTTHHLKYFYYIQT